jgi:hypothetical protein
VAGSRRTFRSAPPGVRPSRRVRAVAAPPQGRGPARCGGRDLGRVAGFATASGPRAAGNGDPGHVRNRCGPRLLGTGHSIPAPPPAHTITGIHIHQCQGVQVLARWAASRRGTGGSPSDLNIADEVLHAGREHGRRALSHRVQTRRSLCTGWHRPRKSGSPRVRQGPIVAPPGKRTGPRDRGKGSVAPGGRNRGVTGHKP